MRLEEVIVGAIERDGSLKVLNLLLKALVNWQLRGRIGCRWCNGGQRRPT